VEDHGAGIDIQIRLKDRANTRFEARRRRLAGPVGCGLCGIESIEEAMRSVDAVGS
jgi:FdhD protein